MTKKDVFIFRQGDYAILMAKDHFHGVEVQVVKYTESFRVEGSKRTPVGTVGHVVWKQHVSTTNHDPSKGEQPKLLEPEEFKKRVKAAENAARSVLAGFFLRAEEMVDGALSDYRSQHSSIVSQETPETTV